MDSGGGGDANPGDGSSGGMDAGPCGFGANVGSDVDVQQMASTAPTPTGGTIADGTYVLTSGTLYTGAGGATGPLGLTLKQTWHFAGTAYSHVSYDNSSMTETRQGGTYMVIAGTFDLHLLQSCPDADVQADQYTATTTTLTLYSTDASGTLALVLTLR